jgi:RsiW-degrading membrane proteinase PrsW (M82 family)
MLMMLSLHELLCQAPLAFAPGAFWLWRFRHHDDLEPEPALLTLLVFGLGCLSVMPILWLRPTYEAWIDDATGTTRNLLDCFLVTALPEEGCKLLAFLLGAWLWSEFDEPLDGVVYGVSAGLGFASLENFLYLRMSGEPLVIFYRAFTATVAHAVFTGGLGFCLARARFGGSRFPGWLWALGGLALAVALHGAYDFFLVQSQSTGLVSLLLVLPVSVVILQLKVRWARAQSPIYHPRLLDPSRPRTLREAARSIVDRRRRLSKGRAKIV